MTQDSDRGVGVLAAELSPPRPPIGTTTTSDHEEPSSAAEETSDVTDDPQTRALCDVCELYSRQSEWTPHKWTEPFHERMEFTLELRRGGATAAAASAKQRGARGGPLRGGTAGRAAAGGARGRGGGSGRGPFVGASSSARTAGETTNCSLSILQEPAALNELGITGARVWDGGLVLARYLEYARCVEGGVRGCGEAASASEGSGSATATSRIVDKTARILRSKTACRLLELGGGTGISGVAAACLLTPTCGSPHEVLLTDQSRHVELLDKNIQRNASSLPKNVAMSSVELDWSWESLPPGLFRDEGIDHKGGSSAGAVDDFNHSSDEEEEPKPVLDLILGADLIFHEDIASLLVNCLRLLFWRYQVGQCILAFELRSSAVTESFLEDVYRSGFEVEYLDIERCLGELARPGIVLLSISDGGPGFGRSSDEGGGG